MGRGAITLCLKMKKYAVWVLLLGIAFPLFSQAQDGIIIYVPSVSGTGSAPEDNRLFIDLITNELQAWNFSVAAEADEMEYFLIGTLAPSESVENRFLLSLSLQNKDGAILQEQSLNYSTMDEASTLVPTLLYNIFSNVFDLNTYRPIEEAEPIAEDDPWRNQEWYLGAGIFWNPRLYYGDRLAGNLANFAFEFSAEYHFLRFATEKLFWLKYLSASTGIEIASDGVVASPRPGDVHYNTILQIPLFIKYVWRPDSIYMHEPYAGIVFNFPLFLDTTPSLLSWATGFQFGMKAGPGIMYADARYSMDFTPSGLHRNRPTDTRQYQRFMLYLGIGYKYNLVDPFIKVIKTHIANARRAKGIMPTEEEFAESEEELPPPEAEPMPLPEELSESEEELTEPEEEPALQEEELIESEEELPQPEEEPALQEEPALPEEELTESEEELPQPEEEPALQDEELIESEEEPTEPEEEPALPEEFTESEEELSEPEPEPAPPEEIIDIEEELPQPEPEPAPPEELTESEEESPPPEEEPALPEEELIESEEELPQPEEEPALPEEIIESEENETTY